MNYSRCRAKIKLIVSLLFSVCQETHIGHVELDFFLLRVVRDAFQVGHSTIVTVCLLLSHLLDVLVARNLAHFCKYRDL